MVPGVVVCHQRRRRPGLTRESWWIMYTFEPDRAKRRARRHAEIAKLKGPEPRAYALERVLDEMYPADRQVNDADSLATLLRHLADIVHNHYHMTRKICGWGCWGYEEWADRGLLFIEDAFAICRSLQSKRWFVELNLGNRVATTLVEVERALEHIEGRFGAIRAALNVEVTADEWEAQFRKVDERWREDLRKLATEIEVAHRIGARKPQQSEFVPPTSSPPIPSALEDNGRRYRPGEIAGDLKMSTDTLRKRYFRLAGLTSGSPGRPPLFTEEERLRIICAVANAPTANRTHRSAAVALLNEGGNQPAGKPQSRK